jgi:GTPase SAR1 family protein
MTVDNIFVLSPVTQSNGNGNGNSQINSLPFPVKVYAAYPNEAELFDHPEILTKIVNLHIGALDKQIPADNFTDDILHANVKALRVDEINLLTIILPENHILGLVVDERTNPYDYRNELVRLLLEYFLKRFAENHKEKTMTTLLLTLFVDLRKYDDEISTAQEFNNQIMVIGNVAMIKAFVYGIDNAGKSSLMRFLATGKYDDNYFPPTKKFRITNIKLKSGAKLVAWDMPGQKIFREDWLRGAQASNILIFMLDVADRARYDEAATALWNMLNLFELQKLPLLFLVNKTDLISTTPSEQEIMDTFHLYDLKDRKFSVLFTSIARNTGITEAVEWIENQVDMLLLKHGLVSKAN